VLVWTAAIASQVVIIGGAFAWTNFLAQDGAGSSPADTTALITVWVSDPNWHVAPELYVGQHSWLLMLSQQGNGLGVSNPDAEAVVVLWGDAELSDPHPTCYLAAVGLNCGRPMSSAAPGSYQQVQVPKDQADSYVQRFLSGNVPGFPGQTVPAQVFSVTEHNYSARGSYSGSVFPITGQPSSSLETTTSTGWSAYLPTAGDAGVSAGCSQAAPATLPAAIAAAVPGSAQQGWYETSCPGSIQLLTGADEHFSDSTVPPSSTDNGIPTWTAPDNGIESNGGFWVDVADPGIAATAQRDLFFAGVLAGIAGGLLAGWLAAGVTFIVKRYTGERG
jgi:hypothetical protein